MSTSDLSLSHLMPKLPPEQGEEQLVVLERVSRVFRTGGNEVVALNEASLEVPPGEFVVFLGPSGSGKTTLLNVVGGLDQATFGTVRVAGYEVSAMDEGELTLYRRDVVGFVFQFFNLIPTLTARENIELIGGLVEDPADVDELLRAVGLSERGHHFPSALSGGEQQRVAIARALVKRPALLLADEPTGSLDYDTGVRVLRVLRDVSRRSGCGVFLVTHNQEISRMADRIVRLHSGRVAEVRRVSHPVEPEDLSW